MQEENTQGEDDTQRSQGEEPIGETPGESQEEEQEGQDKSPRTETQEESSVEDNKNPPSGKKDDSHSILVSEEDSEAEQRPGLVTKQLTPLPESSAALDIEDPLGIEL